MSSTVSDWERQRTLNSTFAHYTPQQRVDFMARLKVEQDKADKQDVVDDDDPSTHQTNDFLAPKEAEPETLSVEAPEEPLTTKRKPERVMDGDDERDPNEDPATAVAQPAGQAHEIDGDTDTDIPFLVGSQGGGSASAEDDDEPEHEDDNPPVRTEATMTGASMITPKPMFVMTEPATEVIPDQMGHGSVTSSGTNNGHTHMAYYDDVGNGTTSVDDGHSHVIRSFMVGDYQTGDGGKSHGHPGPLPRAEDTPGSEFMNYTGEVTGAEVGSTFGESVAEATKVADLARKYKFVDSDEVDKDSEKFYFKTKADAQAFADAVEDKAQADKDTSGVDVSQEMPGKFEVTVYD